MIECCPLQCVKCTHALTVLHISSTTPPLVTFPLKPHLNSAQERHTPPAARTSMRQLQNVDTSSGAHKWY